MRTGGPCIYERRVVPVSGLVHDGGMSDGEHFGHLADDGRPQRPCLQCKAPVTFDGHPGDATCEVCGARQYLMAPSALYPTGGLGRYG